MAIQGGKLNETVTIYNPILEAYQEISVDQYKLQLASFGLTEKEIDTKVKQALGIHRDILLQYGLSKKEVSKLL